MKKHNYRFTRETLAEFDRHIWLRMPDEADCLERSHPVVGFDYQSYLHDVLHYSTMRPGDMDQMMEDVESGKGLTTNLLLHFSDNHSNTLAELLSTGMVEQIKDELLSLVDVALLHNEIDNDEMAFVICCYLMRQGWTKKTIEAKAMSSIGLQKTDARNLMEQMSFTLARADKVVFEENLQAKLPEKIEYKQKTKL